MCDEICSILFKFATLTAKYTDPLLEKIKAGLGEGREGIELKKYMCL
jgi:hypothetical protein